MEASILAAMVGAIGGLTTGTVGSLIALHLRRQDHAVESQKLWVTAYEKTLLEKRLTAYQALWALTERASRQYVDRLNVASAQVMTDEMTHWYYRDGGILLTASARESFFRARESLSSAQLQPLNQSRIAQAFSALRTALCTDLNSRLGPALEGSDGKAE